MGYKFKSDTDSLIDVKYTKSNEEEILLITKKAMAIRFSGESVSFMGKIAAGVTGISLKDDDEVLYADILGNVGNLEKNVLIKSKHSEEKINIENVKLQNRAGRGKSLMLLVMDDNIIEIK
jgi:DNA gyrase/topoisomerase IV subunit A